MNKAKCLLVDGFSLAFRVFYALPEMRSSQGFPTQLIYGFFNKLEQLVQREKPQFMATVWDPPGGSYRKQLFEPYKANRSEAPDDFKKQIPVLHTLIQKMGLPLLMIKGYEADDVIASIAHQFQDQADMLILSGDRDLFQLANQNITLLYPTRKSSEEQRVSPDQVQILLEVSPKQVPDLKALMGDSSDNIPGLPGVGPKTAVKMLQEFPSIESILKNAQHPHLQKWSQKILENKEKIELYLKLTTLHLDLALPVKSPEELKFEKLDFDLIQSDLQNLEIIRFGGKKTEPIPKETVEEKDPALKKKLALMKYLLNPEQLVEEKDLSPEDWNQYAHFETEIKKFGLEEVLQQIEWPLYPVLDQMQLDGIKVDLDFLMKMQITAKKELERVSESIYQDVGEKFNLASPKQLGEILFGKLKMPVIKKTKTGYSTDSEVLEELAKDYPLADKILEFRQINKLLSTYIETLPAMADEHRFIHARWRQTATATGRISCVDPNLQNIPIRSELGKKIRQAFGSRFKDGILLAADYSQIELRLMAHIADVPSLIESFKQGEDIHKQTASEIFHTALNAVTDKQRSFAKTINFGIIYGMGANGLAKALHIRQNEAKEYIAQYFEKYPQIRTYIDETKKMAHELGYVKTLSGRIRFLRDIESSNPLLKSNSERAAINAPIQGSAADLIKLAMLSVAELLKPYKSKMVMQIHDELIVDIHPDEFEILKPLIKQSMEQVMTLKLPLQVDLHWGQSWYEASK